MDYKINKREKYKIEITDHILDNVYGHIGITEVERKIERLPLFKRLHNISQLGLTNLIFPCALHNRYVHSIGVMYMASEMARHINENVESSLMFSDIEIQILRLAGMLHDIGHYPMSHNIELAYKLRDGLRPLAEKTTRVADCLKDFVGCPKYLYPDSVLVTASTPHFQKHINYAEADYSGSEKQKYHHEAIGKEIVVNNSSIFNAVKNSLITYEKNGKKYVRHEFVPEEDLKRPNLSFSEDEIMEYTHSLLKLIGAIIIGSYEFKSTYSAPGVKTYRYKEKFTAMVQLIHSELDADNIDYLLRDSTFSGTSYGLMDVSILLNNLTMAKFYHIDYNLADPSIKVVDYLVGIKPKGVGCVDQFFQNKYLAYTQMIFNKHVSGLEFMMLHWAKKRLTETDHYGVFGVGRCVSKGDGLLDLVKRKDAIDRYLNFTDSYVMNDILTQLYALSTSPKNLFEVALSRLAKYTAFDIEELSDGQKSDNCCSEFTESKIAEQMLKFETYQEFKHIVETIGDMTVAEFVDTDVEKQLFSFRFEEYSITKQLPYDIFYKAAFCDNSGNLLPSVDLKQAFQNHYYRLANGIPVLSKSKYILEMNSDYQAEKTIPNLVVDYPEALLHNTYQQKSVYLRKYDIKPYN